MPRIMNRVDWLRWVSPVLLVIGCGSSGPKIGAVDAAGSGGSPGSGGGSATGGTGGESATGGGSGTALVACSGNVTSDPGALANPADFSINSETGAMDQHTLVLSRADMIRQVTMYLTGGNADHQHEFRFTSAELGALSAGQSVVVTTEGPPLNAAAGHSHTVTVRPCGATTASTVGGLGNDGGTAAATCVSGVGAIANPPDFSVNPETNTLDQHFLVMNHGDLSRGQSNYFTGGAADHQHEFLFTFEERQKLIGGQAVVVMTLGPPLNAAIGHAHTVTVSSCLP